MIRLAFPAALGALVLAASSAAAQQVQGEVHANWQHGTSTGANAWGAGAQVPVTFGVKLPVALNTSLGADYLKQENSGPSAVSLTLDAAVQPGGSSAVTPYVGGSVGSNWSFGDNRQFSGARFGTEAIGGLQIKPESQGSLTLKAEERFGYVRGQEHTLTTRLGVMVQL